MSKKLFVLIVLLMSISLVGIIAVQLYWINNAIESKKQQFQNDVQITLGRVSEIVNQKEKTRFYDKMYGFMENQTLASSAVVRNFLFQEIDTTKRQKITYGATVLEENFELPTDFLDNETAVFKRITGKKDYFQSTLTKGPDNLFESTDEKRFSVVNRLSNLEKSQFEEYYKDYNRYKPLHQRISNRELSLTIKDELKKRGILLDFKYGVYGNDGLATKLKSGYYTINIDESFKYPLLYDSSNNPEYLLYLTFPSKNEHILSGISSILLLSLFFIFIIILAFSGSLYQLMKQKKISEIKTDFINNMTHEFKTPIATINLALDSIKSPKVIEDQEKILRYVKMIRDENKRMHAQVESVLRISRLEKNQLEISKESIDMHDIIEEAQSHVNLLLNDKQGTITNHFEAITADISGNQFHLTNVVINMLENAIKYSVDPPKIDVYTESTNKFFIFKIKDEGIGMSKSAQKMAFDKFYREQKGNIHDVKGHGLGLAYVKEIIEKHHGTCIVESEKGVGSTFTVKLPLI